jgi:hypothetical protein
VSVTETDWRHGCEAVRIDVSPGAEYEWVLGGRYAVVGLGDSWPSGQEVVVYRGLGSWDTGRLLVCTPADFARKFTRVVPEGPSPPPDEPLPEKVAGPVATGRGW